MALAKKCDICGKLYEYYNNEGVNGIAYIHFTKLGYHDHKRAFDCCPLCLSSINNYIESLKGETK